MSSILLGLCLAILTVFHCTEAGKYSAPKVVLYSREPGEYGKDNTLICHVSNFHPPDIDIQLTLNGDVIPGSKLTDLAFGKDWRFHLTKDVSFTPERGQKFGCRVKHEERTREYEWDPNM